MGSLLFTVYGFVSFNYCEVPRCSGDQCHEHLGSTYITKCAWKMSAVPCPSPQACWGPQGPHTQTSAGVAQQLSLALFPAKSAPLCLSKLLLFPGGCSSSPHAGSSGQPSPGRRSRLGAVLLPAPSFLLPFIFLRLYWALFYITRLRAWQIAQMYTRRGHAVVPPPPPVTCVLFICSSAACGLLQPAPHRLHCNPYSSLVREMLC